MVREKAKRFGMGLMAGALFRKTDRAGGTSIITMNSVSLKSLESICFRHFTSIIGVPRKSQKQANEFPLSDTKIEGWLELHLLNGHVFSLTYPVFKSMLRKRAF